MQAHRNNNQHVETGISLSPAQRKKLSIYLQNITHIKGFSKIEFTKYRNGQKEFMPYKDFKLFAQFSDDFLDLFIEVE